MSDAPAVAVTGVGVATPLGFGAAASWSAWRAGRRAAPPTARAEEPRLRGAVPEALESQAKLLNASGELAASASAEAVAAADLASAGHPDGSKALYLAQFDLEAADYAGYRPAFEEATDGFRRPVSGSALNAASLRRMSPFHLLSTINNNAFSFVSAWHGLAGSNTSLSGWSGNGLAALALAARAVRRGDAAAAVACAAASLVGTVSRVEQRALGLLADDDALAEAAAALVLETLPAARARGARPAALVLGDGGAFGERDAPGEAVTAAAEEALARSGAPAPRIGAVLAPDARVAREALGRLAGLEGVAVLAPRDVFGHAGLASDLVDAVLAAVALAGGRVPGPAGTEPPPGEAVLLVSWGVDGAAEALVLGRVPTA